MDRTREELDRPNQQANKEPAEGSRETVAANQPDVRPEHGAGITNRPLDREEEEQRRVPPRGMKKDEELREGGVEPGEAGKTSGGGSVGHDQPEKVRRDTPLRNNATGRESDPVMPADDSTLRTKI